MLNRNLHREYLIKILKDIYSDIEIGPILGFKGGTALYFFYNLPRFSVDLDFDLLDENKASIVFDKTNKILKEYGDIKDAHQKKYTTFFLLSYGSKEHNIKIEINNRNFNSNYEIKNYLGISIKTMKIEDMFAHKLVALLERKEVAHRDIFDIWFFLKNNYQINEKIVKYRVDLSVRNYLKQLITFLEKYNDKYILQGMGELVDEKTKSFIKNNLLQDTVFLLKVRLESF